MQPMMRRKVLIFDDCCFCFPSLEEAEEENVVVTCASWVVDDEVEEVGVEMTTTSPPYPKSSHKASNKSLPKFATSFSNTSNMPHMT